VKAENKSVVFIGQDVYGGMCLGRLLENHVPVSAVITRQDYPEERGNMVKDLVENRRLPLCQPEDIKGAEVIRFVKSLNPFALFVASYGQKLPPEILGCPVWFPVNFHPSLLPKYRGATPINWAIINGEVETGVTAHFITEGFDNGRTISQEKVEIRDDDTAQSLNERLADIAAIMAVHTYGGLLAGNVSSYPQDETKASWFPKRTEKHAVVDWRKPAKDIHNLIRGMCPYPLARSYHDGRIVRFSSSEIIDADAKGFYPGYIVCALTKNHLMVATGDKNKILGVNVHDEDERVFDASKAFVNILD